jgi:hypothetical protein
MSTIVLVLTALSAIVVFTTTCVAFSPRQLAHIWRTTSPPPLGRLCEVPRDVRSFDVLCAECSGVLEQSSPELGAVLVEDTSALAAMGTSSDPAAHTPSPSCSPTPARSSKRLPPRPVPQIEAVRDWAKVAWTAVPVYSDTEAPDPIEGHTAREWRKAIQKVAVLSTRYATEYSLSSV